jgi:hypothetical protein
MNDECIQLPIKFSSLLPQNTTTKSYKTVEDFTAMPEGYRIGITSCGYRLTLSPYAKKKFKNKQKQNHNIYQVIARIYFNVNP